MNVLTIDFETFYSDFFSLSKMTTEEYIRSPLFEPILMGFKVNDGKPSYVTGRNNIQLMLDSLDVENSAVLCHHAHFDGLIMSHHFGVKPKIWFDTLPMARAVHGTEVGGSLKKLLEHYDVGIQKGSYVVDAKGKRLSSFSPLELQHYGMYCMDDVEGTYRIFLRMMEGFPKRELQHIDLLTRMFTEPLVELDEQMLREYALTIQSEKMTMLLEAGVQLDEVMSNEKFAEALRRLGVEPPTKISPTTFRQAYAFAKTDAAFIALQEDEDVRVQQLVAARLGNKTTIEETRAQRLASMATRGPACIYYKYAGAEQTMRVSGGDKTNFQNLKRGGVIRDAIYAPEGYDIVVVDSSNIEARVLDWLAMQEDALLVYRHADAGTGPDAYCVLASRFYGRTITTFDKPERQLGKTIKLACGYQMGPERFRETTRIMSGGALLIDMPTATKGVNVYRDSHPMVRQLWQRAQSSLQVMAYGSEDDKYLDSRGVLVLEKGAILLPNGLRIKYPKLAMDPAGASTTGGAQWSYHRTRGGRTNIYGGKVIENVVQALAKIIVMDQLLKVSKKFRAVMTSHDEGAFCVKSEASEDCLLYALEVMSKPPEWAPDLPVFAKGDIGVRYGEAK